VARIACESVARELTAEEKAPALEIGFDLLQSMVFVLLTKPIWWTPPHFAQLGG
jgi:hypothetical protein